jgi:serine/threonine protein kinase
MQRGVRNLLVQLLHGLEAVHNHGILHRDIKPNNIYLLADDRPVLLDFGAAQQLQGELITALTGVVTHGFSPLELYADQRGLSEGPWSDLYSLGATFYQIVTGCIPLNALARNAGRDLPPAVVAGQPWYPASLLHSIDLALNIQPDTRYQIAQEWLAALEDATEPSTPSSRVIPMVGIGLIALLLASGGYFTWQEFLRPSAPSTTISGSTPTATSASTPKSSPAKSSSVELRSPADTPVPPPIARSIPAPSAPLRREGQDTPNTQVQRTRDKTITIFIQGDPGTEYSGQIEVTSVNGTTKSMAAEGTAPKTYTLKGVKVSAVFRKRANNASTLMASITDEKMYPEPVSIKKTNNAYGMINISLSSD